MKAKQPLALDLLLKAEPAENVRTSKSKLLLNQANYRQYKSGLKKLRKTGFQALDEKVCERKVTGGESMLAARAMQILKLHQTSGKEQRMLDLVQKTRQECKKTKESVHFKLLEHKRREKYA